ncbi:MAG: malic enzyme-like NAD(P)-binding protein [Anaerolineales bacterium]|jgi:malate dehydrogenase (oxaloacetate-decarboxylating)
MSWENKLLRIVRVVNAHEIGTLGRLLSAITAVGGNVGDIELLSESTNQVVREITIFADDEKQLEIILDAIRKNRGTKLLDVRDEVMALHLKGKIAVRSRYPIDSIATLQKVYTPGVAEVCMKIAKDPALAHIYTSTCHLVAIVTDGTAVLGLGDIGPLAGMPVMEGKAMLMETLVGLSGVPILLNTKDPDEIIKTVAAIAPTFAAIQLEDISAPRCFRIEEELQRQLDIPVMHDDQHGTAVVATAVLTVACRRLKKELSKAVIGQIGLGAAGNAIAKILIRITGNPVWGADLSEEALKRHEANGGKRSDLKGIMANCDIVISTTGVQGLIKPGMVRKGQVILALSNPHPEIEPEVALKHGAAFAADGKLVNNVLGFPGIFRGAVDTWSPRISDEMLLAASEAIANHTTADQLVPNPLDRKLHQAVAHAVALKAIEQGLARAEYVPYIHE